MIAQAEDGWRMAAFCLRRHLNGDRIQWMKIGVFPCFDFCHLRLSNNGEPSLRERRGKRIAIILSQKVTYSLRFRREQVGWVIGAVFVR